MPNNIRATVGVKDNASNELDRIKAKFTGLQKQGAKGFAIGASAAITAKGINLVADAASGAVAALGDMVEAAIADEESQRKLGAALQANIPNWDGQTDAIERVLESRMKLGYSDDEQRQSLATLVAVTKDSTKALDLQRKAMDLARLRNIDLQAASDILGKVYGGNIGILSRYGIQVKKGATATEALAQITELANGQAEAWANTTRGKLTVAQVQLSEAMEKLGYTVLPAVAEAADAVSRAFDNMSIPLEEIEEAATKGSQAAGARMQQLQSIADELGVSVDRAWTLMAESGKGNAADIRAYLDRTADAGEAMRGRINWSMTHAGDDVEELTGEVEQLKEHTKTATERTADYFHAMAESIQDDVDTLQDEAFDPIEERLDQQATHFRIVSAIESRESAKGKDAVVDANRDIVEALDDQVDKLQTLGKRHKLTAKDVDQYEADVTAAYKAMGKKVPPEIQKVIAKLRTLAGFNGKSVKYTVRIDSTTGAKRTGGPKAAGGTVAQGMAYPVGENGPEMFVPDRSGTIIPTGKAMAGATYNYNLTVLGDIRARDESSLLATMRRLQAVARPNVTSMYG